MKKGLISVLFITLIIFLVGCTENPEGKAIKPITAKQNVDETPYQPDYLTCTVTTSNGCSCTGNNCWSDGSSSVGCMDVVSGGSIECNDVSGTPDCTCQSVENEL